MKDLYADLSEKEKQLHFDQINLYQEKLRRKPVLKNLFLEMTIKCNAHCLHCGSNCGELKEENPLSDHEILQTLIKLKDEIKKDELPLPFISVTGGEPLMRKDMISLMKTIHALGYSWGMTSNGTLIDQDTAYALKDAGMYSIGLSLDGLEKSHEWFRNSPESFLKTWNAFDYLTKAGISSVMITSVIHKKNIGELDALYELMKEKGVKLWRIINIEPIGRALEHPELLLDGRGYKQLLDFIAEHQEDHDMNIIYSCNHYAGLYYERRIRNWYFACNAGTTTASIQYDGKITACLDIERRPELVFGNIRKDNLYSVWKTGFQIFRKDKSRENDYCKDCEHAKNCKGGGFHTWDFDKNRPKICMIHELEKT